MLEEILNRLEIINKNVESNNYFFKDYPKFLNDLEYILIQLPNDYKQLSIGIQFRNGVKISEFVTDYYIKLIAKYMKIFQTMDIYIKKDNTATMLGGLGGYIEKNDCIYIGKLDSSFRISTLHTICHEVGHKRQKDFGNIKNFEEILKYPHYMIILLKEQLSEKILEKNDPNFYRNNYDLMYYEQEANIYSFETIENLLVNTYKTYLNFSKRNSIKVSNKLLNQMKKIQKKINEELLKIKENSREDGKFNIDIINEFYSNNLINSKVTLNGNKVDRLIFYDKCLKENPKLQQEYPVLKLIFNGNRPKSYQQIVKDLQKYLKMYPKQQDKIKRIYYSIIKSDPILYISYLVQNVNISLLKNFLANHESVFQKYRDDINEIIMECNNDSIIQLLKRKTK